jgi:hypothetical protein
MLLVKNQQALRQLKFTMNTAHMAEATPTVRETIVVGRRDGDEGALSCSMATASRRHRRWSR